MADFLLRDATNDPQQPLTFPGWIAAFEALGFVQIGRVLPAGEVTESYFTRYGPEHEDLARRSVTVADPVLASPDSDAFVEIGEWFFDTPTIRLRTILADGSLVETQRRWEHRLQPLAHGRHADFSRPIENEMLQSNAPSRGRSVVIADGDTAADIWTAHQEHVARRTAAAAGDVVRHDSIDYFIALSTAAHHHDLTSMISSSRSMKRVLAPFAFSPLLLPLLFWMLDVTTPSTSPIVASGLAYAIGGAGYWFFFAKIFPRIPFLRVPRRLRARFTMQAPPIEPATAPVG